MSDVNLIPQEEKREQSKKRVIKSSSIFSIILFFIVGGIGGYIYYQTDLLKKDIEVHEANIGGLRADIEILSDIEIDARNLGQRYGTLKELLELRKYFSTLMTEFNNRVPETVEIATFGIGRESTINVSGIGDDYISIAKFIGDLSDKDFPGASEGLGGLFPNVALNSVNLDAQTDKARFFIVVTVSEELLRK